jgi:hypothetical protein
LPVGIQRLGLSGLAKIRKTGVIMAKHLARHLGRGVDVAGSVKVEGGVS